MDDIDPDSRVNYFDGGMVIVLLDEHEASSLSAVENN
jgi:hypothetical protein